MVSLGVFYFHFRIDVFVQERLKRLSLALGITRKPANQVQSVWLGTYLLCKPDQCVSTHTCG
jgi:hypothetical protein